MRLITKSEPKRIMASAGQNVNHLDEIYDGKTPDILDNGYVLVDFENGIRAMLELCMFAEGSKYQEEIIAVGPKGKLETKIPGPARFWPKKLGDPPVPLVIQSPRYPMDPKVTEVTVDPVLLEAGDHNGSTYYQHKRFLDLVLGKIQKPDVTLEDGYKAVIMGMAAQESAKEGRAVEFD
jgi:myo-inositol 2-dehydrogenase/D-chiro-inositol 1-dehydrogenase